MGNFSCLYAVCIISVGTAGHVGIQGWTLCNGPLSEKCKSNRYKRVTSQKFPCKSLFGQKSTTVLRVNRLFFREFHRSTNLFIESDFRSRKVAMFFD